jgi:hypothetical protein
VYALAPSVVDTVWFSEVSGAVGVRIGFSGDCFCN